VSLLEAFMLGSFLVLSSPSPVARRDNLPAATAAPTASIAAFRPDGAVRGRMGRASLMIAIARHRGGFTMKLLTHGRAACMLDKVMDNLKYTGGGRAARHRQRRAALPGPENGQRNGAATSREKLSITGELLVELVFHLGLRSRSGILPGIPLWTKVGRIGGERGQKKVDNTVDKIADIMLDGVVDRSVAGALIDRTMSVVRERYRKR
jgi:hypothetical protein